MLAGAAAHEHGDPHLAAVGSLGPRVVVRAGGANRPTTIVTGEPGSACAPPAGSCERTTPSRDGSSVSSCAMFASKPES